MNEERNLAHIEIIDWIKPIEGADAIELCGILGWQCVIAKKDNFKVGDKVVYIEVDSVLPDLPQYEFLKERKFRIRTIKLRGCVSQGLVLPLSCLHHNDPVLIKIWNKANPGEDVTEDLKIVKYLTPTEKEELFQQEIKIQNDKNKLRKYMMRYSWFRRLFLSRHQKMSFPYWISKTDEPRAQSLHWDEFYNQFKDKEVYVTEKIDYQSATFTGKMIPKFAGILNKILPLKKYQFVVASRNMINNSKSSLYWQIAKKYNLEQILKSNPILTIQGEQGDTKVQGNKYGIKDQQLWIFNIINHEKGYQYDYDEMNIYCTLNGLQTVPLLYKCKLSELGTTVNDIIEKSKGKSVLNNKILREGIVIRCIEDGKKIFSFKAINPDFLLKYEN